jgi:glutaminyl-peptide cyclotransferase
VSSCRFASFCAFSICLALGVWTVSACQSEASSQKAAPESTSRFQQATAWDYLVKQCEFGPRAPGTEGHLKCRDWLVEQMKASCENVRLQPFTHRWSKTGKEVQMWNVIGEQNWKDAKTRVLLLAHWDTRPSADMETDRNRRSQPILGANDGASGVAVLLELMRATKDRLPEGLGVMYLMVDGEDLGPELEEMFLGARHFAKNMPSPKPDYGILLDMVGDKNLRIPMEMQSLRYAEPLLRAFYRNAAAVGLRDTFPQVYGPYIEDDHIPLNEAGLRTIDLIDFDYAPWHTLADTPDKCSADSLGKVGKAMETWLLKTPVWTYPAG